jgi:hypothetical protein
LERVGFVGWQTWGELGSSHFSAVPNGPAAYVLYRPSTSEPFFLAANPGGRFKQRDPTVAVDKLKAKWVAGAHVIYIGKADLASRRLADFARFGAGEPVGHWGGRYVWQLADSAELLVAWQAITWGEPARGYEKRLLARFSKLYGKVRPFANLTG